MISEAQDFHERCKIMLRLPPPFSCRLEDVQLSLGNLPVISNRNKEGNNLFNIKTRRPPARSRARGPRQKCTRILSLV